MLSRLRQNMPKTRAEWLRVLASYSVTLPLVAASFAYLLLVLQTGADSRRMEEVARVLLEQQVAAVNRTFGELRAQASHKVPLLAAADVETGEHLEYFPGAVSARWIPLGRMGIADRNNPYLERTRNNIEMDMLRRARESGEAVIEAYEYRDRLLLTLAQPGEGGVALISYPRSVLQQVVDRHSGRDAETRVIYRYRDQSWTIAATTQLMPSHVSASQRLEPEGWFLHVTPSQAILDAFAEQNRPLLFLAVLCILAAVFNLVYGIGTSHRLNEALEASARQARGSPSGAVAPPPVVEPEPAAIGGRARAAVADRETAAPPAGSAVPASIFRAYDIRGVAESELTAEGCQQVGLALGSEIRDRDQLEVLVGRDGRNSSPMVRDNLVRGLRRAGVTVVDLGMLPTPMLHFASRQLGIGSVAMVTGSHNPAEYNGVKMLVAGKVFSGEDIQGLRSRIERGDFHRGQGSYRRDSVVEAYIRFITGDVILAQTMKVVIDAGNGVAGTIAPRLFSALGCRVEPLYCEVDGDFPNHPPDPTVEGNLKALQQAVRERRADLGIALDGDGDRLAVVSASGRAVAADELLMILARDVVGRNPGAEVLFDVKCSRHVHAVISELGGRPTVWKCGHSFMKLKMAETGALLGGEYSGHIFFNERWFGFDDGMYVAARLLEMLSMGNRSLDGELAKLPESVSTPEILVPVDEREKFSLMTRIAEHLDFDGATLNTLDGVRAEFSGGWGLVRASNTAAMLTLRFEAQSEAELERIRGLFREALAEVEPGLREYL